MEQRKLSAAADAIRDAESVVALTGAGISTASGIPDFRSENGIWNRYDPNDFHISRFRTDPEGFWHDRVELIETFFRGGFEPNEAHAALAELEAADHLETLITQNVDGLHQAAGNDEPIEIHGNGQRAVCTDCDRRFGIDSIIDRVERGESPPTCERCGGLLKPDVVLFGERLPRGELDRARAAAQNADVFLAIGSSLTVEPAASLPRNAVDHGGRLIIVNLDRTDLSGRAEYDFRADVTDVLPALSRAVIEG